MSQSHQKVTHFNFQQWSDQGTSRVDGGDSGYVILLSVQETESREACERSGALNSRVKILRLRLWIEKVFKQAIHSTFTWITSIIKHFVNIKSRRKLFGLILKSRWFLAHFSSISE